MLEMSRGDKKQALNPKSKITRNLKEKMLINERKKGKKYLEKFGYRIPNNPRELYSYKRRMETPCGMAQFPMK